MQRWTFGLAVCLIASLRASASSRPIELSLVPRVAIADMYGEAIIHATWRIVRDTHNRYWTLEWSNTDSGFSGSSLGEMAGADARVTYEQFLTIWKGVNRVEACAYRDDKCDPVCDHVLIEVS